MRFVDMRGQTVGRLTVVARGPNSAAGSACWYCRCSCGVETLVVGEALRRGTTQSCGCYHREIATSSSLIHGHSRHRAESPTYRSWQNMMKRCTNPEAVNWERYGGRGIRVCRRWLRFANFLADMGERPAGLTLDRKNNAGNYHKRNCRWATPVEQARNRRKRRVAA